MSFTDISYLELWQSICLMEQNNLCNFGRTHHKATILRNYFEFGPVVQEEMSIIGISYLES